MCESGLRLERQTDRQTSSAGRSNGLSYRRTVEIIHSKYDRLALQQAINLLDWDSTSEHARVLSWLPNNCTSQGGAATTSMAPKCAETIKITFLGKRNPWHGCQKSRQTDKSTNKQCQTMSGYTRGGEVQAEVARKRFRYPQRHLGDLASTQLHFQFPVPFPVLHMQSALRNVAGITTRRRNIPRHNSP